MTTTKKPAKSTKAAQRPSEDQTKLPKNPNVKGGTPIWFDLMDRWQKIMAMPPTDHPKGTR